MENVFNQPEWTHVCEIELVYKTKIKASARPHIHHSSDIYRLLLSTWNLDLVELQEEFKVLLLNRRSRVLGLYQASIGGITGTVADTRLILAAALKAGACAIVLAHNHPSSDVRPSREDELLTHKIREAAKYHDMRVIDHLIITAENYFSFADEGLL